LGSGSWHMEFNENADLTSVYWSPVFRRMIGYRDTEDFPNDLDVFFDLLHEDDKNRVIDHYWNAVKDYTNRSPYDIEYRLKTKNRGYRYFHAAGRVARREDGSPISIVGFFIDIDDKKKSEERLRLSTKARAEQLHILQSLANMYFSMHLINLLEDSAKEYAVDDILKPFFAQEGKASKILRNIMSNVVKPPFKKNALEFIDLNTLPERMRGLKSLSSEFNGIHAGWFIANFITVDIDRQGRPTSVLFTTQIIDEQKRREEILFVRSVTDEMTGFYNRRAYEEKLEFYRHNPIEDDLVISSLDINRLKYVNDNLGHIAGDELIRGLAAIFIQVKNEFKFEGKVYRIGGDEFICLLHENKEQYAKIEERFDELVQNWKGKYVNELSYSHGTAFRSDFLTSSIDDMVKAADKGMYKSKSSFYMKEGLDRRK